MRFRLFACGTFVMLVVVLGGMALFPAGAQVPSKEQSTTHEKSAEAVTAIMADAGTLPTRRPAKTEVRSVNGTAEQSMPSDPIVIPNCRLTTIIKEEVPSQQDGVLEFIGLELKSGEPSSPSPGEEIYRHQQFDGSIKFYRRLREGDQVEADQLVGQVDDALALAEVKIAQAKLNAARADKDAADKTRDEAQQRYYTQQQLYGAGGHSTSLEDLRGAKLSWDRYVSEALSKAEAISVAKKELEKPLKTLEKHQIRSKIAGTVKAISKHSGEAVRGSGVPEGIVQVQNYDLLRAEGQMDQQYARTVHIGDALMVEATVRQGAQRTYISHRLPITSVAVSKDQQNPFIVSASEDGMIMVWKRTSSQVARLFNNQAPVCSVACTPMGSDANLCLSGDMDGNAKIWDLNGSSDKPIREFKHAHRGRIRCVAFSPDGKACATGGEDHYVKLWDVVTGNLRYRIPGDSGTPGHRDSVTSLYFTPQGELISNSRDQTVRIWRLSSVGAEETERIKRRSAEVAQLGVSADGTRLLDDQGAREMRVLLWPGLHTENILQNISKANSFRTFAVFAPDGQTVLTNSGNDGVLQLWRLDKTRGHEVRSLIPALRSEATCAAFATDGSFVVEGVQDGRVYLFPIPTKDEIDRQIMAKVTDVEFALEGVNGQVKIMAEFTNPADHPLIPGETVTLVGFRTEKHQ